MMKTCKVCGEEKDVSCFYKNSSYSDGLASKCKECHIKQTTENYHRNPSINESNKKRYFQNIDAERNRDYKRKYGISLEQYNEMLESQNSCCSICGTSSKEVSKNRLFVDHCHRTGKVRGLLCHHCNSMIGLARDDVNVLSRAISYLKENNDTA